MYFSFVGLCFLVHHTLSQIYFAGLIHLGIVAFRYSPTVPGRLPPTPPAPKMNPTTLQDLNLAPLPTYRFLMKLKIES